MKVIKVSMSRGFQSFVLYIHFDNGFMPYIDLSNFYRFSFSWAHYSTSEGFLARPEVTKGSCFLPFSFDFDGNLVVDLPTCAGYLSLRGKWLTTGNYHRVCTINVDDLLSSVYY